MKGPIEEIMERLDRIEKLLATLQLSQTSTVTQPGSQIGGFYTCSGCGQATHPSTYHQCPFKQYGGGTAGGGYGTANPAIGYPTGYQTGYSSTAQFNGQSPLQSNPGNTTP